MDGFTIVDAVVAVVIIISAILAYSRGFVREAMSIVGWIVAAILAFMFAGTVKPLVEEIPFVGNVLRDSCELAMIASFAAVLALALILVSLFTPLFASIIQRSALGGLDQGLGFFFGVLRGLLLVAVALVVYDRVTVSQQVAEVSESRTYAVFAGAKDNLNEQLPEDAPSWIVQRYEQLVRPCGA
ncbi:Colicin V production protein [Candidatus Rhodobacter oscarellae]|uniref:Colicin V production protein n=1 Tax=Candidatus Rhodobacter oscarellae TaxID=1675527 RepID=A0A0J9GU04_9RHOB|nr:CvpA family protein [Candidatus Rhodobacter lobularis]KMW57033.1 Colicin V production protein [Candidatus Rhodobacter lobularis]